MGMVGDESGAGFPGQPLDAYWKPSVKPQESVGQLSELGLEHFLEPEDEGADEVIPLGTTGPMKSVIGEQWHLIIHKKFGNQLYDWVHDPSESRNVIHTAEGEAITGRLMAGMQDALAGETKDPRTVAVALQNDRQGLMEGSRLSSPVNEYFHFQGAAGAVMRVNVRPEDGARPGFMDPVVTITDADGQPLEACRDPEDDWVKAPAAADPTPEAFDDVCINDDISPGVQTDSQLEILVPGKGHSPVELYVRVSDWNGRVGPGLKYKIGVSGPDSTPAVDTAKR